MRISRSLHQEGTGMTSGESSYHLVMTFTVRHGIDHHAI